MCNSQLIDSPKSIRMTTFNIIQSFGIPTSLPSREQFGQVVECQIKSKPSKQFHTLRASFHSSNMTPSNH